MIWRCSQKPVGPALSADHLPGLGLLFGGPIQEPFGGHFLGWLRLGSIHHVHHHEVTGVHIQGQLDLLVDRLDCLGLTGDCRSANLLYKIPLLSSNNTHGPTNVRVACPPTLMPFIS